MVRLLAKDMNYIAVLGGKEAHTPHDVGLLV